MKKLLKGKNIKFKSKELKNGYRGYILYSDSSQKLNNYFEESELKKSKLYNKCIELNETAAFRFFYYQELTNNRKHEKLIIIMMNPSFANSTTLDPTIKNINKYLKGKDYRSFEIVNLHHIRTPKPAHLQSYLKKHSNSDYQDILKNYIKIKQNKKDCKIVAAWGKDYDDEACNFFGEEYKNFWVFALNKKGSPSHFAAFNILKTKFKDFKQIRNLTKSDT